MDEPELTWSHWLSSNTSRAVTQHRGKTHCFGAPESRPGANGSKQKVDSFQLNIRKSFGELSHGQCSGAHEVVSNWSWKYSVSIEFSRQCCWPLKPDNSLLSGAVMCIARRLPASLASAH